MLKNNQTTKAVLKIAIPAIVESFFVAFAGLVDSLMVSSLGSNAVAAVGLTNQPKFVGLAIFMAISVSVSALVARRFGEKRKDDANSILYTALILIVSLAAVFGVLFTLFASPIIRWCGSSQNTHNDAVTYYKIIMSCMIFNCIQIGINSMQRGAGNTKITMRTNITSNTVNIIGNYLLIGGKFGFPALGIRGAAIATVFGSFVACIMSILSIFKKDCFISIPYIIKNKIRPKLESLKSIIHVGYSVFLEQLLMRVGFMATAVMAAKQGDNSMAAHQVCMHLMSLSFSFGDGLQAASVALIGRSLGEKNPEKAKAYGRTSQRIGLTIAITLSIIYFLGSRWFLGLFFKEKAIIDIGIKVMYFAIAIVVFQIPQCIYTGSLRGAGDTRYTAFTAAFSVAVLRTIIAYVCCYTLRLGLIGVWMGILGDQVVRYLFGRIRFKQGKWVNIKI
ncbi:MAG: MATE family efflux transporter [Ruminococcaceae bacterium]|nr:MATE family efflux transporter [Oscillospiraceae bacterium]